MPRNKKIFRKCPTPVDKSVVVPVVSFAHTLVPISVILVLAILAVRLFPLLVVVEEQRMYLTIDLYFYIIFFHH